MSPKTCLKILSFQLCACIVSAAVSSCAAVEWVEDAFETSDAEPNTPIVTQISASDAKKEYTERQAVQYAASKISFFLSAHGASPRPGIKAETTSDGFVREVVYELLKSNVAVWGNDFVISSEKSGNVITVKITGKENYTLQINVKEETLFR